MVHVTDPDLAAKLSALTGSSPRVVQAELDQAMTVLPAYLILPGGYIFVLDFEGYVFIWVSASKERTKAALDLGIESW